MSALDFRHIKRGSDTGGPCSNKHVARFSPGATTGYMVATWRAAIVGHPAGLYCDDCKKQMETAWNSALTTTEPEAIAA